MYKNLKERFGFNEDFSRKQPFDWGNSSNLAEVGEVLKDNNYPRKTDQKESKQPYKSEEDYNYEVRKRVKKSNLTVIQIFWIAIVSLFFLILISLCVLSKSLS